MLPYFRARWTWMWESRPGCALISKQRCALERDTVHLRLRAFAQGQLQRPFASVSHGPGCSSIIAAVSCFCNGNFFCSRQENMYLMLQHTMDKYLTVNM